MHASNRAYDHRQVALTTKHCKEKAIALPFRAALGLETRCASNVDTDLLGTFTGEIRRKGTAIETSVTKARLGMRELNLPLGLSSEGSFGPHPFLTLIPGTQEFMTFIDDERGFQITEQIVSTETNYNGQSASKASELQDFFVKVKFPSHGLIVRPNMHRSSIFAKATQIILSRQTNMVIFKGLQNFNELERAIEKCKLESSDGMAYVETDMRAHMNPTRLRVIRKLAIKLGRRLQKSCPECNCPGWGLTDSVPGLPCVVCSHPSDTAKLEISSCAKCKFKEQRERADGIEYVDPGECHRCNP
ncbi:MAG: hypothetical protein IAF58_08255 [Leptolyngbya sp.]|nr:hypothetical protein [Candidatus Melainabacteria bacterium]